MKINAKHKTEDKDDNLKNALIKILADLDIDICNTESTPEYKTTTKNTTKTITTNNKQQKENAENPTEQSRRN